MAGQVQAGAAAFPSTTDGVVLISQCQPCQARSGTYTGWVAVTRNAGGRWSIRKQLIPTDIGTELAFAGTPDGWTLNGWVTHDGGTTWHRIRSAAGVSSVAIADGTVWAERGACSSSTCAAILRGSASGDTLTRTLSQPVHGYYSGDVVAATADTAYLDAYADTGEVRFATRDGGRSWHALPPPCPSGYFAAHFLTADSANSVWQICERGKHVPGSTHLKPISGRETFLASHSVDGGRSWHSDGNTLPRDVHALHPVSPTAAWADGDNTAYRSSNGGRTWTLVFTLASVELSGAVGQATLEIFHASSATTAQAVLAVPVRHGTQLVVAYTHDAGRSWQPEVLALPSG